MNNGTTTKIVIFEPVCNIKDIVYHILDDNNDYPMIVINYNINSVNNRNEVVDYTVGCSFPDGRVSYFKPYELKIREEVKE